jgi:hypothetical protein
LFSLFSKAGSYQAEPGRQQGSAGNIIVKENRTNHREGLNQRNMSHERSQDFFANRTYDVIEPPEESELNVDIIEKEASLATEHIYETIEVYTRTTSCQTESFVSEDFTEAGQFVKVFKEISCQTETSESRLNKKRNSDTKDMTSIGKTKECRLSSDSSTSTQDSQESADSGHFSVRNPERSPRSPQSPYLWQPEGLNHDEVSRGVKGRYWRALLVDILH